MNFKYFCLILLASLIIITSSISYGFDNNKCKNLNSINFYMYDKSIEQAFEDYTFHFSNVYGWYYSLNQLTTKKCPMLLKKYSELSKNIIRNNMLNNFPTNKFIEKSGLKTCLLSHLFKKNKNKQLSIFDSFITQNTNMLLKNFEDNKKVISNTLKNKFKQEPNIDLICNVHYESMYKSKKGYGKLGKEIQKIENEAATEIKKINDLVFFYCLDNDCEFN
jgi:hypothetical protein